MGRDAVIGAVGDVHGHLHLALCVMAGWQDAIGEQFDAVFLCGDVGSFTHSSQLDDATRKRVRRDEDDRSREEGDPSELEFLHQWSTRPQAPWLDYIFKPKTENGLGLACPVVMVHGNHEGFEHLERLVPPRIPRKPVSIDRLPAVDTNKHIRLLPSGWKAVLPESGFVAAGVGGIQPGQRKKKYPKMAYIAEEAVGRLKNSNDVDVLVTHQGPSSVQGDEAGASLLDDLLHKKPARVWFHGHSIDNPHVSALGRCQVVPLDDIAPDPKGKWPHPVGEDGWAWARVSRREVDVHKETPPNLDEFRPDPMYWRDIPHPIEEGEIILPVHKHLWHAAEEDTVIEWGLELLSNASS